MITPLSLAQRTRNTPPGKEHCRHCGDAGYVVAQTRPAQPVAVNGKTIQPPEGACFEEMGPCPYCEAGFREEFPDKGKREHPIVPPWGEDGFWGPRGNTELVSLYDSDEAMRPASLDENKRRLAELLSGLGNVGREMLP